MNIYHIIYPEYIKYIIYDNTHSIYSGYLITFLYEQWNGWLTVINIPKCQERCGLHEVRTLQIIDIFQYICYLFIAVSMICIDWQLVYLLTEGLYSMVKIYHLPLFQGKYSLSCSSLFMDSIQKWHHVLFTFYVWLTSFSVMSSGFSVFKPKYIPFSAKENLS